MELQNQSFPCLPCSMCNVRCTVFNQILWSFIELLHNCVCNATRAMLHFAPAFARPDCSLKGAPFALGENKLARAKD